MQQVARYGEDSIRIAYGFYSQTLTGYNKSAVIKKRVFLRLDDGNGSKSMRTFIVIDVIRFAVFLTAR